MSRYIALFLALLGLAGCGSGLPVTSLGYASAVRAQPERLPGRVYLLRGLIGDVFSLGMDELAAKIERRGIKASVHGVSAAFVLADRIVKDYRADPRNAPIVLIGHSTGGDAIIAIAHRLKAARVPVALAVGFDPTPVAARVPSNVDLFINLFQATNLIGGGAARAEADFRGRLINVDLRERREILHITLDKSDAIHDLLVRKIAGLAERAAGLSAENAKPPVRDREGHRRVAPETAEVAPLRIRYTVPPGQTIELWDSAFEVRAQAGDTVEALARRTGAPAWAIAQVNRLGADHPLQTGQALLIPRNRPISPHDLSSRSGPDNR